MGAPVDEKSNLYICGKIWHTELSSKQKCPSVKEKMGCEEKVPYRESVKHTYSPSVIPSYGWSFRTYLYGKGQHSNKSLCWQSDKS